MRTASLNLGFELLIFAEAVSMKNISHFLETVIFWFAQKTCLDYLQNL